MATGKNRHASEIRKQCEEQWSGCAVEQLMDLGFDMADVSIYEEETRQICNDVYEYQQMQPSHDVSSMDTTMESTQVDTSLFEEQIVDGDDGLQKDDMSVLSKGLCVDPTEDYDMDDFEEVYPVLEKSGNYGIRGKSTLLPTDACDLLRAQRLGGGFLKTACILGLDDTSRTSAKCCLSDEFKFVPNLIMALLISMFPDETTLKRMLSQSWVRNWEGWREWNKKTGNGSI